jgi:hypothetical protein
MTRFTALGAVCSLVAWMGTSIAQEEASVLVLKPAESAVESPTLPPPSNPNQRLSTDTDSRADQIPPQPALPAAKQKPPSNGAKRPFMRPAVPKQNGPGAATLPRASEGQLTSAAETLPPPQGAPSDDRVALDIRPTPPIVYDTDGDARDMYRATGEIELVMVTQNPADGCYYEIPMCIPGCCEGEPRVSSGRGIFGRGVVEYCWSCGFKAEVRFRHILGDVKVDYEGD